MFKPDPNPNVEIMPKRLFRVAESFSFVSESLGEEIVIEKGFITDLASVPRYLWFLFPPHDTYAPAAIVHDKLWRDRSVTKAMSNRVFLEAMKCLGISGWKRYVLYSGVQLNALRYKIVGKE